jgi:hypothetical protein
MQAYDVKIRWAPGHTGIEGNEAADKLAGLGVLQQWDAGLASEPTASGIRSVYRDLRRDAQCSWWAKYNSKLSPWYKQWKLDYKVKLPPELELPRPTLHRLLAIRSAHGDFSWYHRKYVHDNAKLTCSCGRVKDPEHLVRCRKTARIFRLWPHKPLSPPADSTEGIEYLMYLMEKPADFAKLLTVTEFYSKICPR